MLWDTTTVKVIATQINHNLSSYWGTPWSLFVWFFFMCSLLPSSHFHLFSSHLPYYCFLFTQILLKNLLTLWSSGKRVANHSFLNVARCFLSCHELFPAGQIAFYLPNSLPSFYYYLKQSSVIITYMQFNSS